MHATTTATHVTPADQPTNVHQITERLFPAYRVDGGSLHLAGCTLEDRLFLRLVFQQGPTPIEICVDDQGREVADTLVDSLGMDHVVRLERPLELLPAEIAKIIGSATRLIQKQSGQSVPPELISTTFVWCKYVRGKLRFTFGEETVDLPFDGWTRTLEPPPYECPYTGRQTFHLAATDDGRIAAADQVQTCEATRQRVLSEELVRCSVTGQRVLAERTVLCPVTRQIVLLDAMVVCRSCHQRVSPAAVKDGECVACRELQPVNKADPRMARLLDEHPPLDRWRTWKISETATVYILMASGWLRQLLVVVDKESLELKHVATRNRLLVAWTPVEPAQYDYVLRE